MEFVLVLRELLKRRLLLAVGVLVAVIAAIFSVYSLNGTKLKTRSLQYSSASTQVLVDSSSSVLGNLSQSLVPLSARAVAFANFMVSPAVLSLIGQHMVPPISGEQIYAAGPITVQQARVEQEPTALKRNVEITGETNPYRLNFSSNLTLPTINIYAQAPTTPQAIALANAAVVGLQQYVSRLERADRTPSSARVTIRQLGPASGGVVNGGISKALMAIVFVAVLLLWCVLLLVGVRLRENWRASGALLGSEQDVGEDDVVGPEDEEIADAVTQRGHAPAPEADRIETHTASNDDLARVPTRSVR
jgi:hypothetical protein